MAHSALHFLSRIITMERVLLYSSVLMLISWSIILRFGIYQPNHIPGVDFVTIYTGAILANSNPASLYDVKGQHATQDQIKGSAFKGIYWEYGYPPFFAFFSLPLASLSYEHAYWAWSIINLLTYLLSILALLSTVSRDKRKITTILTTAMAAPAFLWVFVSGQTTTLGLFFIVASFCLLKNGTSILAGVVMGLLMYRPQFLSVIVPMLALKKWWSILLGLVASIVILFIIGAWNFSFSLYFAYYQMLQFYWHRLADKTYPISKFISLYAFFRMYLPHAAAIGLVSLVFLALLYWLAQCWKAPVDSTKRSFDLQFALTIPLSLLLMHYTFIHDLLLLTLPAFVIYNHSSLFPPYCKLLLAVLYFAPYYAEILTLKMGLNVTPLLLLWLSYEIYRACERSKTRPVDKTVNVTARL